MSFPTDATAALPAASNVTFNGTSLAAMLATKAPLDNPVFTGDLTAASGRTFDVSGASSALLPAATSFGGTALTTSLAALAPLAGAAFTGAVSVPGATADASVVCQYTSSTNQCSNYNSFSVISGFGSFGLSSGGTVQFLTSSDSLGACLLDQSGISLAGTSLNSAFGFGLWFPTPPTYTAVLLQLGTLSSSVGSALSVTLETTGGLSLRASTNNDYYTYAALASDAPSAILVVKSSTSGLQLYVNGVLQTPTTTSGSPGTFAAWNSNALLLGATPVGAAWPTTTISNLVIVASSVVHTPTSFAALALASVATALKTTGLSTSAVATKTLSVTGPATLGSGLGDAHSLKGTLTLAGTLAGDLVARYPFGATNEANSAYNTLSGPALISAGTISFVNTTDYVTTSLFDSSGTSIVGVAAHTTLVFTLAIPAVPSARVALVQIGAQTAYSGDSLGVSVETSGALGVWLSSVDVLYYGPLAVGGAAYAITLIKQSSGPVQLYLNATLQTSVAASGAVLPGAFTTNTLTIGASALGIAPVGMTISTLAVYFGSVLYSGTSMLQMTPASQLGPSAHTFNAPSTFNAGSTIVGTLAATTLSAASASCSGALSTNSLTLPAGPVVSTASSGTGLVASYTLDNTNQANAYGNLVYSKGTVNNNVKQGALTFVTAQDALTASLYDATGATISGATTWAVSFSFRWTTAPASSTYCLMQLGTQSTAGTSLLVILNTANSRLMVYTSSTDYFQYQAYADSTNMGYLYLIPTGVTPFQIYNVLIVKSPSGIQFYQGGVLIAPETTSGSPATVAGLNGNTLILGNNSNNATIPTLTLYNVQVFNTYQTPATIAAITPISSSTALVCRYTLSNTNDWAPGLCTLAQNTGTLSFPLCTLTSTTDQLSTTLVDSNGATIVGNNAGVLCLQFTLNQTAYATGNVFAIGLNTSGAATYFQFADNGSQLVVATSASTSTLYARTDFPINYDLGVFICLAASGCELYIDGVPKNPVGYGTAGGAVFSPLLRNDLCFGNTSAAAARTSSSIRGFSLTLGNVRLTPATSLATAGPMIVQPGYVYIAKPLRVSSGITLGISICGDQNALRHVTINPPLPDNKYVVHLHFSAPYGYHNGAQPTTWLQTNSFFDIILWNYANGTYAFSTAVGIEGTFVYQGSCINFRVTSLANTSNTPPWASIVQF
jgi:hypothetical protein